jgi:hypothetical protein
VEVRETNLLLGLDPTTSYAEVVGEPLLRDPWLGLF